MQIVIEITNEEMQKALSLYEQCFDWNIVLEYYDMDKAITLKQLIIMAALIKPFIKIEEN